MQRQDLFIEWASQIAVPVLLTYGVSDVVADPLAELAFYSTAPSRSVYVLAESAHCNNYAAGRQRLWQVLALFAQWAQALC
jgi:alpha-beta hydrolase superfamily lysophospholipase